MDFNIEKIDSCTGHKGSVFALCAGKDAGTFYSSGEDGTVVLWNVKYPDLGSPIAQMAHSVYALHLIPELNLLVVAQNQSGLHFINLDTKVEEYRIAIPQVSFFEMRHIEKRLFVSASNGAIHSINLHNFTLELSLRLSDKSARCIALDPEKRHLAVGYSDYAIRIFDIDTFSPIKTFVAHQNSVFGLCFIGQKLVSVSRDAKIKVWDSSTDFDLIEEVPAHLYAINHVIKLENLNYLITCSMDKSIKVWDVSSLRLLKVINKSKNAGHGTSINKVLWLPESQVLLAASDDRTISVWNLF
jgi:WD40 repeat protein